MKHIVRNYSIKITAVFFLGGACIGVSMADTYPTKPIQIIVPFTAGGDADMAARNLVNSAQSMIDQPIVIVNKPGASGSIGSAQVKNADPDGYTLLLGRIGSQVILPALQPDTTPYNYRDFTFLGILELNPVICIVHPESKFKSLNDLAEGIKKNPGKLNYSHSGVATIQNLAPQIFLNNLGLNNDAAINVPYKGGNEVALAVMAKEVDFACNNLSSMTGLLKSNKLRALVTTTPDRLSEFPDVPTASELGYKELAKVIGWSGLFAPKNLDKKAMEKWVLILKELSNNKKWIDGNSNFGGIPYILSPDESDKFISEGFNVYKDIFKNSTMEIK